jgi:hypothetical protein
MSAIDPKQTSGCVDLRALADEKPLKLGAAIRKKPPRVTGGSPDAEKQGLLPGPLGEPRWEREFPSPVESRIAI